MPIRLFNVTAPLSVSAILFDRDNTLSFTNVQVYREAAAWLAKTYQLDPENALKTMVNHWNNSAHHWNHIHTLEQEEEFWREYALQLIEQLSLPAEFAAELLKEYPYERFMQAVPGVREMLLELRQQGLKIGVLSNTLPSIERTLVAIGLADLIDCALSSCTLGVRKPDVQAFKLAATALQLEPADILFIDDLEENIVGAKQAGMHAKLIDLTGQHPEAIHHPKEIISLLQVTHV